jgi:predicted cupin superfamily sugar epimerase
MTMKSADAIIRLLKLKPHPEGGWFRETFRDPASHRGRAHSTAIYFLLKKGEASRWHRVDAVEVWHWYAGAPLELKTAKTIAKPKTHIFGNDLLKAQRPQIVVPANQWQCARTLGDFTLVGCTVAPGFLFEKFELAISSETLFPKRVRSRATTRGLHNRVRD